MTDKRCKMDHLCRLGSHPECHPGWRCCNGNCCRIYDLTLWFTYCWLPLWSHLYLWLLSVYCKCCKKIHLTVLLNVNSFIVPLKCLFSKQPFLEKRLKIQDTCGIHNLHAVPGLLGGVVGAITAATATSSVYSPEG